MASHGTEKTTASATQLRIASAALFVLVMSIGVAGAERTRSDQLIEDRQSEPAFQEVSSLRNIVGFQLRRDGATRSLQIEGDGPVVWTSFRDGGGRLVVELPNSQPGEEVLALDLFDDLIRSAKFKQESAGQRPSSRLVVDTYLDVSHAVVPTNGGLVIELTPLLGAAALVRTSSDTPNTQLAVGTTTAFAGETAAGALEFGPAPSGVPATQLQGVDVTTDDGTTSVWIAGDGAFYYSHFSLTEPYRFVIDLIGVVNTSPVSTIAVQGELVDGIRVAQYKPQPELVSRVVIDLVTPSAPTVAPTPDGLKVTFAAGAPVAAPDYFEPAEAVPVAGTAAVDSSEIGQPVGESLASESYQEARGADSLPQAGMTLDEPETSVEAMPEVEMEAEMEPMVAEEVSPAPVWVEPEPSATAEPAPIWEEEPVQVARADEPEPEFEPESEPEAAPVWEEVDSEPMPSREVEAPTWDEAEDNAWEEEPETVAPSGSLFDVSVDLTSEADQEASAFDTLEVAAADEPVYTGEPMTLSLQGADVKDVLRSFAQISGLNVVVQPGVTGSVTIEFTDVPWDQALDQILKINGLDYELEGNIMRVAPVALLRAEAEEKARLEAAKSLSIPLKTIMRRISYATASDIASILGSGGGGSIMSDRGSALVDSRTNTLIIKELPSHINTVIAVIENLDIPEPQVMIEARIIETTKRFSKTLGIQLGFNAIASAERGNTTGLQFPNSGAANGGVNLLTGGSNGFLDITLGNVLNTFNLDAFLQAAESEGLINILSAPRITTLNNEQASIQSGLQIPIQTIANNTVSVQFVNATLRLDVTPHVTAEGTVLMDIDIQKREPQLAFAVVGASNAPISTKDASTRVIVRDGGTTVIGGIYKVTSDQGEDRVPGLSNVPILKHLFKNKRRNDENEELLIFITPRVVKL